jgi:hypothetical protein
VVQSVGVLIGSPSLIAGKLPWSFGRACGASMTNVVANGETATFIASRIARFASEANEKQLWLAPYVAEFNALPLFVGWTETIGIRAEGEIITWSTEQEFLGVRAVEDQTWVLTALVAGSKQYPELQQLLPQRGTDAVDCGCRDVPPIASGEFICGTCGGLGWVAKPQGA